MYAHSAYSQRTDTSAGAKYRIDLLCDSAPSVNRVHQNSKLVSNHSSLLKTARAGRVMADASRNSASHVSALRAALGRGAEVVSALRAFAGCGPSSHRAACRKSQECERQRAA